MPIQQRIGYFATQSGFCSVVSTNDNCEAESDPIELKIGEATTAIPVSPTSSATYQLASVANACGLETTAGQATVSVSTGSADVSDDEAAVSIRVW